MVSNSAVALGYDAWAKNEPNDLNTEHCLESRNIQVSFNKIVRRCRRHCKGFVRSSHDLKFLLNNEKFLKKSLKMSISHRIMCYRGLLLSSAY